MIHGRGYDSDGAIAWAKENFEGEDNPYFIGIISGMSQNDLIGASELMTTLPYGRTRGRAASILVEKTWQMGEDVAIHFADNLPEGSIQNYAFGEIAKKIAKDDLGRAVQWVEKMDESEVKVRVSEDVAERWARKALRRRLNGYPKCRKEKPVRRVWRKWLPNGQGKTLRPRPSGLISSHPVS